MTASFKNVLKIKNRARGKLVYLFVAQVAMLILYPYFTVPGWTFALFRVCSASAFLAGVYAVSDRRARWMTALVLAIPAVVLNCIAAVAPNARLTVPTLICALLFLGFTLASLFRAVVRAESVTQDTIYGALSVYMLMANVWAVLYLLLQTIQPSAFAMGSMHQGRTIEWTDCLFYSFVTLTSLGYGDIVPITAHARSLSVLEAICGIMYVAVLIARLVGVYTATARSTCTQSHNVDAAPDAANAQAA